MESTKPPPKAISADNISDHILGISPSIISILVYLIPFGQKQRNKAKRLLPAPLVNGSTASTKKPYAAIVAKNMTKATLYILKCTKVTAHSSDFQYTFYSLFRNIIQDNYLQESKYTSNREYFQ